MEPDQRGEISLPEAVCEGLERFCRQLRDMLGEQLVSVILYGGSAREEPAAASPEVNVMVVVRNVTIETLDNAASPVRQGMRDFQLAVMLLSEDDLRRSTDVFPIKFLDMQQHHRVLCGEAVLADLPIARDHLRLRCEQEIKNLLLRLRQFYLERAHRPELIERTLVRAISSLLIDLSVLLMLKTGQAPSGSSAIAEAAAREFPLDGRVLGEALALREGRRPADPDGLKRLYEGMMALTQQAADVVDQM